MVNVRQSSMKRPSKSPKKTSRLLFWWGMAFLVSFSINVILSIRLSWPHDSSPCNIPESGRYKQCTKNAPACSASIDPDDISYTLVTQLSSNRANLLARQCTRWKGPISAAIFTSKSAETIEASLTQKGCAPGQVTFQLLNSSFYDKREYPVNKLRNIAMSKVKTTHALYVDVDFLTSTDIQQVLNMDSVRSQLAIDPKFAAVVPAYEIEMREECTTSAGCWDRMPQTMEDVRSMTQSENIFPFDHLVDSRGHVSTDYEGWIQQEAGSFMDVGCFKNARYEPYILFRYCRELPPFAEQFVGYGKNKISWIQHLRHVGYKFSHLGGAFVVHYPHPSSVAKREWKRGPRGARRKGGIKDMNDDEKSQFSQFLRGKVDSVYVDFRSWLSSAVPRTIRTPLCPDAQTDDEKLWV